ncbi:hypothetical protein [Rickettsia canadensis]|uniref:Uncharacterized protein n=1 Tax=Rickettsia canadensis str. CA410 TaxID=1105107 RepID=A0ABN4AGY1_RICCA|nr:hypothetical protein [Rickettsia canadensis]AFB21310.1 hypothetical protein RCA_03755 [Rickettsia canadensis str. CA410]
MGFVLCLELIFDNYKEIHITESLILKLHSDMLVYSDNMCHKGNYKFTLNRVEAKDYDSNVVGV